MNKQLYDKLESMLSSYGMSAQTTKTAMIIVERAYDMGVIDGMLELRDKFFEKEERKDHE